MTSGTCGVSASRQPHASSVRPDLPAVATWTGQAVGALAARRSGLVLETVRRGLRSLTRFAISATAPVSAGWPRWIESLLERYLADLAAELAGRQRHGDQIGQLSAFLQAIRVHRWEPSLPATAMLFSRGLPQRAERPPRALAEQVMAQLEQPDNLDRWNNDAHRLVTLDPDPLRPARHRRPTAAARLCRPRRRRRALPALLQPQDETRGTGPHRRRTPRPDQPNGPGCSTTTPVLFPRPTKNPDGKAPMS